MGMSEDATGMFQEIEKKNMQTTSRVYRPK